MTDSSSKSQSRDRWLGPGVAGIGTASLLSDAGHEIPTSLLPSLLTSTLGAPAAALGLIEGIADATSGVARFAGGPLADDPIRRRQVAVGGYTITAVFSAAIGLATSAWQVGVLRTGAWAARGLRVPARNALLADVATPATYGRAYGFERTMDNLGAVVGPLLALGMIALFSLRTAIVLSIIPGLLASVAIFYAIRHAPRIDKHDRTPIRIRVRPVLRSPLGPMLVGIGVFEIGNMATTLLILRATDLLKPEHGVTEATSLAIALYAAHNLTASLSSLPAGHLIDRSRTRGSVRVLVLGVSLFVVAYGFFAWGPKSWLLMAVPFVVAGAAIGCVETAEHTAVASHAPEEVRGSAFGLLAAMQSVGNLIASGVVGLLWTLVSPTVAFGVAGLCMLAAIPLLLRAPDQT